VSICVYSGTHSHSNKTRRTFCGTVLDIHPCSSDQNVQTLLCVQTAAFVSFPSVSRRSQRSARMAAVEDKAPSNLLFAISLHHLLYRSHLQSCAWCIQIQLLEQPNTDQTEILLQNIPLYQKAGAGLAAGGLGALVGSPADLSLIRMQSDSTLPEAQRRNYKGVGDALTRIVKDEGAIGLFRGAGPTVTRAMALNMGMLASNDQASNNK